MRYVVILISLLLVFNTVDGQQKKKGKVKRKYRQAEQVNPNLPATFFRGQVRDLEKNPLPGAHVTVEGLKIGVHTNEDGYFLLKNLPAGRVRIVVSFLGYEPKSVDYILQEGQNYHNITLREKPFHVDPVTVVAQNRAQQILDVPTAINALDADFTGQLDLTELRPFAAFVPGLYIREQGANRPTFSIRGITSDEVSPSAQPRISVFFNHVPVSRASGASLSLFDMDRVEVLKGPQNTLFGRGAQMGAIHFIPEKPTNRFGGYISAGGGDYNQREIRGAVNVPLIEDMLFVRAAGIYDARDGYVENTFGGTLNGKNTLGGRFSLRFLPAFNHKIDLVLNMQKDETPGIAFMSRLFPNSRGEYGVFDTDASLEQGRNLGTGKDLFNAMLTWQFYKSENTSWTTVSSFRKTGSFARWEIGRAHV